jgi:hypothetical protein
MEHLQFSYEESNFKIEGFPDALKVIRLEGKMAKRMADLKLHMQDLEFANGCLDSINSVSDQAHLIREALWRSAVVHFVKCFGLSKARFQLSAQKIFKDEPPEAMLAFEFFVNLRNKHFIHDENSYAQCISGAILNNGNKDYKIERIICFAMAAGTLEQANYGNLKLLVQKSYEWAEAQFNDLATTFTAELERQPYATLLAKDAMTIRTPTSDEISKTRDSM